jgi:hypothetical protein
VSSVHQHPVTERLRISSPVHGADGSAAQRDHTVTGDEKKVLADASKVLDSVAIGRI